MKKLNFKRIGGRSLIAAMLMLVMATTAFAAAPNTESVWKPIVELLNSLLGPALAIVGALGSLFCVILGVKFAKAEEPQEREKAKTHLKNAIIGFVLIFVLILALDLLMPIMEGWVNANGGNIGGAESVATTASTAAPLT